MCQFAQFNIYLFLFDSHFVFALKFAPTFNMFMQYADWKNIDLNMFEYIDLFKERNEKEKRNGSERKEMKIKMESLQQNAMQIAFMDCEYE